MRFLYNLLTYLLLIPFAGYWLVRGIGNRTYSENLGQRFGFGYPKIDRCIWVHAVSVGEVQASAPLIRALKERYADRELLITTVTPTGAARVRSLFGDTVQHSYIPFEFPHAIRSFFRSVNPEAALIMETEIWPNLYRGCGTRKIPLILVSARISPRSVPGYRKLLPLIRETLSHGIIIAAQSQPDADRFLELGANPTRTCVMGNIKFDIEPDGAVITKGRAIRGELFGDRPVWIAASTHEGEEKLVLEVHRELCARHPELLLVLVPRHPERFPSVRELIEKQGFSLVSRTAQRPAGDASVFLCDTMGEVPMFYAASDVAFVAGSLVPIGGHNLLEPAMLGVPIVTGPHNFNAQDIADLFVDLGACRRVTGTEDLVSTVSELLTDRELAARLGNTGRSVLEENRGALERLLVLLEPLLSDHHPT
ncbi:MAG: lipid IV(A) 3-deoxy-D-manno-octulosonic acid transferase [Gammaproteobacteria bacterium]|nr:lipid IV(A) 3-deoxy-D-manno-octulosonic acid transferase [Gammaproteobacteria bacterium]MDH3778511.1 lipid IV(A) 3-deoxy-D-manno-octulosonic acid transferase [Gammaproteobacteria bacterium]MDH3811237.1 lipid IV(A) 3-deoxy-D-manno-octulosonic acid transferase [Gammaproteobacteria bacterium]